jgi:hypothetical protein
MESEACSNFAAFRLWAAAHGQTIPLGDGWGSESVLGLIPAFVGERDRPPRLLAGLLLSADLRPDDRLWVVGPAPAWLDVALGFTAGRAMAPEAASVWIGPVLPDPIPAAIGRIILTEEHGPQGRGPQGRGQAAPAGVTLTFAGDWY